MRTVKVLNLLSALLIASATLLAQNSHDPEAGVREVINRFEVALQQHDLEAIEALVSPDLSLRMGVEMTAGGIFEITICFLSSRCPAHHTERKSSE